MEGGLTHIQGFHRLSDNVGMFYPRNKSVPNIGATWSPSAANLGAMSAYLFHLCKSPKDGM